MHPPLSPSLTTSVSVLPQGLQGLSALTFSVVIFSFYFELLLPGFCSLLSYRPVRPPPTACWWLVVPSLSSWQGYVAGFLAPWGWVGALRAVGRAGGVTFYYYFQLCLNSQ